MQEMFKEFDSLTQSNIEIFFRSTDDILVVYGEDGCGKSALVKRAIAATNVDFLIFNHNCFEFSTIGDFLLNFYDTFKTLAADGKITLKKAVTNQFSTKIVNYFKETPHNFLITVDNFKLISDKKDIVDFLLHIASFKNVKLIIISETSNNFGQSEENTLEVKPNSKWSLSKKIKLSQPFISDADIDAFYNATKGSQLFLSMSMEYIKSSGVNFADFIGEYGAKKLSFQDFLINKIVSLIPENYYQTMKNFALLYHPSTRGFLKAYSIAKPDTIEYLLQKMALTDSAQGYYLKNYLRNFFISKFSVQEKISGYRRMLDIYEKELAKSPSERLLRLSRESIRNLIEHFSANLPKINIDKTTQQSLSYMPQTSSNILNWNAPREEKPYTSPKETPKKELSAAIYIEQAEEFEKNYAHQKAIEYLNQAKFINNDEKLLAKILSKLSKNYIMLDQCESAISCELELSDIYKKENTPKYYSSLYRIGTIYKNKFDYKQAQKYFEKILANKSLATKLTLAKTYVAIGEIKGEKESYEKAIQILHGKIDEKTIPTLTSAYFKIAQIYDNKGEFERAKEFYQKNINTSKNPVNNEDLGLAYLNLGDILADEQDSVNANKNYDMAIAIFKKTNNLEELYFIYEKLAQNYKYDDPEKYLSSLESAKEAASKLKDSFKLAYCLVEIGDYFYREKQDKEALLNFLEAKNVLGQDASEENMSKINSRIEDMRIKMGEVNFKKVAEEYE